MKKINFKHPLVLAAGVGIVFKILFSFGYFIGVREAEKTREFVHYSVNKDIKSESGFYSDSYGLHIGREVNKDGNIESYLCNFDGNIKKPIDEYMVSGYDSDVFYSLEKRIKNSNHLYSENVIGLCERVLDYELKNKPLDKNYKKSLLEKINNLKKEIKK